MQPRHLSPTERDDLQHIAATLAANDDRTHAEVIHAIIANHAAPNPCITSRIAFGQTLQCVHPAGHDGPHTAIDHGANVHAVWTDEQD